MQINFTEPIKDSQGNLLNVKEVDDDGSEKVSEQEIPIKGEVLELLQTAVSQKKMTSLGKLKALDNIMGDIARDKKEYSDADVKLIREGVEKGLEEVDKPAIIKLSIARVLGDDN